jgi:hypothetical protein
MSIFQKSCSPEETSSLMCMDQTVHNSDHPLLQYGSEMDTTCKSALSEIRAFYKMFSFWHDRQILDGSTLK